MRKLKEVWLGQDVINRVILVSGILACAWCLVKGQGLYGVALLVLMGMLMVSRKSNREKRLSRLYGYGGGENPALRRVRVRHRRDRARRQGVFLHRKRHGAAPRLGKRRDPVIREEFPHRE